MTIGVKSKTIQHYGETKDYLGSIQWDSSYKDTLYGRPRAHNCWRAYIVINGKRCRFRSHDYGACEMWLRMKTSEKMAVEGKPTRETIPPEVLESIRAFGEWMKFRRLSERWIWRNVSCLKKICWTVGELSKDAAERFMESDRYSEHIKSQARLSWNRYCDFLKFEEWKI